MAVFTLTEGNDTLNRVGLGTADSILSLGGNDLIGTGNLNDTVILGDGQDTLFDVGGNNTIQGNSGADSIRATDGIGTILGGDGADSIDVSGSFGYTIAGGNDSSDQADSIVGSAFGDFLLGNGGNDTLLGGGGRETLVGGFANDTIVGSALQDFIWGNENNDTIAAGNGNNSVWCGLGNDVASGSGFLFGNEGGDTIIANGNVATTVWGGTFADGSPDGSDLLIAGQADVVLLGQQGSDTLISAGNTTMTGGADAGDVFNILLAGDNGTVRITDLNWGNDQIDLPATPNLNAAGNVGNIDAANLQAAALAAILIVDGGNPALRVAAQFGFSGQTWLAVDQFGGATPELIVNITGVTGNITVGNFLT